MKQNTDNMKELLNKDLMGQVHFAVEYFNKVNDFNESQLANKTNNMKLYTREEVANILERAKIEDFQIGLMLDSMTPIELPTDDDIKKLKIKNNRELEYISANEFIQHGAKWVIEQIKKQI